MKNVVKSSFSVKSVLRFLKKIFAELNVVFKMILSPKVWYKRLLGIMFSILFIIYCLLHVQHQSFQVFALGVVDAHRVVGGLCELV